MTTVASRRDNAAAQGTPDPLPRAAADAMLRTLVDRHADALWRFLSWQGLVDDDVADVVQETFVVASRKLHLMQPGHERSFLLGVAANLLKHVRRTYSRRREVLGDTPDRATPELGPDELCDRSRVEAMLDTALERLSPELRTAFVLCEIEELSMSEMANALGLPVGTVASRIRRARAAFGDQVARISRRLRRESGEGE